MKRTIVAALLLAVVILVVAGALAVMRSVSTPGLRIPGALSIVGAGLIVVAVIVSFADQT